MNFFYFFLISLVITFFLSSCTSHSLEDYRQEGETETRALIKELHLVHNREDLIKAVPRLTTLFNKLVQLMIDAGDWHEKNSKKECIELNKENHELSDCLRIELNRIYRIEGGREMIEKCQKQALLELNIFEKRINKPKK